MGEKPLKVVYVEFDPLDSFFVDPPREMSFQEQSAKKEQSLWKKRS
jgi:hypothetical protein